MISKTSINTLGATNHSLEERSKLDYYGTDPRSTEALLKVETFNHNIWEPCAGHHLISNKLIEYGYEVRNSDIANYEGFNHEILNFLDCNESWNGDIVTNPPYGLSTDFICKALDILKDGSKLAYF